MSSDSTTGYSPIQEYYIYHNGGSGTSFPNKITATTYLGTTISSLSQGTTYLIRVSAKNIHGEGPLSNAISVIAAYTPGIMNPPIVSQSVRNIIISWAIPTDTGGESISSYKILLLNEATNQYEEHISLCDGTSSIVVS